VGKGSLKHKSLAVGIVFLFIFSTITTVFGTSLFKPIENNAPPFENPLNEIWNKTYGGSGTENGRFVQQTIDGGYIVVGGTNSYGAGGWDVWLIKTNIDGNEEWNKTFGGPYDDVGHCVRETNDGGFIILGYTIPSSDWYDPWYAWLIKTDINGNVEWDKKFTRNDEYGKEHTVGTSLIELDDGYLIMTRIGVLTIPPGKDIWLIKTDFNGNEQWNNSIGCINGHDYGNAVMETSEGDFVIVGNTFTYLLGDKVLMIKTDPNGNRLWRKTLDGWEGFDIIESDNGDYIIAGREHVCLIKTDKDGNLFWKQDYGWSGFDKALSVAHTFDGGYIVTGIGTIPGYSVGHALFIKTDENGNRVWEKTMGGTGSDAADCVIKSNDNTYVTIGSTGSFGDGFDVWLIKIAPFDNHRPNKPMIDGPAWGIPDEQYTFYSSTTDSDGDNVFYWFNWGLGQLPSGLLGPYNSGETCEATHSWSWRGFFTISVKARDIYGGDSDWATFTVIMPVNQQSSNSLFLRFLERFPNTFPILRYL